MDIADLGQLLDGLTDQEVADLIEGLPPGIVESLLESTPAEDAEIPPSPIAQAQELDSGYRPRPHLQYLSDQLVQAAADVERGTNRFLQVSMPPRMGKSQLISIYLPLWLLRKDPTKKIGIFSFSPSLSASAGRSVRRLIERDSGKLGLAIAQDAGAVTEWETVQGGGVTARSIPGQSPTGIGFNVVILDDVVKDFASAHSEAAREAIWQAWLSNIYSRFEPPVLVIAVGTRWHEDDFIGRLLSREYEGDPALWQVINFPALAETADVLGRAKGEPLLSPLLNETPEQALTRWADIRQSIGSYTWAALYQQRPAPAKGAIFDTDSWRFWTTNPAKASRTEDGEVDPHGKVVHLDPETVPGARWLDSWDCSFKGKSDSDYVVGQRWMIHGAQHCLIAQSRARRTFTSTVTEMKVWAGLTSDLTEEELLAHPEPPYNRFVGERLVEDKANGSAVIDSLKQTIPALIPINPTDSKVGRARSVTPLCEAGNVLLPLPSDPGNEWVQDLLEELRNFPTGTHDDQVDALTQALNRVRNGGASSFVVPGQVRRLPPLTRGQVAIAQQRAQRQQASTARIVRSRGR